MSSKIIPPTEQEIEMAMDIISRAAKTRKPRPELKADLEANRKKNAKLRALGKECEATADALEQPIKQALPEDLHKLFQQYTLLRIAPWNVRDDNVKMFRSINQKAKQLMASLEAVPRKAGAHD